MKCVVVGGGGFLGGAIVDCLVGKGDEVVSLDRTWSPKKDWVVNVQGDILDKDRLIEVFEGAEEVYNVAGMLGTSELNGDIQQATMVNVVGACNVFEAAIKTGVARVFYPGKPNVWLNTYSITKQASEDFAQLYHDKYDTDFIRLRWFNAYGPGQHTHPIRKIVPTFCLLARFGLPINIFGSGTNIVDMMHSRDIGKLSVEATRNNLSDTVYELGRGVPVTVLKVADDINKIAENDAGLSFTDMREGETENTVLVADVKPLINNLAMKGVRHYEFEDWMDTLVETYEYYCTIPEEEAKEALRFHGFSV